MLGHLLLLHNLAEGSAVAGAVLADDPWWIEEERRERASALARGELASRARLWRSKPRGAGRRTEAKRSFASLQRKNPKNTRTRWGTGAGVASAVAVRTDFLGALSHLVRVCGNVGVDEGVRGGRSVRYRPSSGVVKPRIDTRVPSRRVGRKREASRLPGARGACDARIVRGRARGRDTSVLVVFGRSLTCTDANVRLEEGEARASHLGFVNDERWRDFPFLVSAEESLMDESAR